MSHDRFEAFFHGPARQHLLAAIDLALAEDGRDLTSQAVFPPEVTLSARIVAKAPCVVAGLPVVDLVLQTVEPGGTWIFQELATDGQEVRAQTLLARLEGSARTLLRAERVILNFLGRMCGIASLTRRYVAALAGSRTRLLDTRKTAPGLRYPDKYAVLCGGGTNHRLNLEEMLMLKDTHLDRAGTITSAVAALRAAYRPCPPIEIECRNLDEVLEAVACRPARIMLDNMGIEDMARALTHIPQDIETEASGGVAMENLAAIGRVGLDFISVGRITHSAPAADLSMQIILDGS